MLLFEFKRNVLYKYIAIFICMSFLLINTLNNLIQNTTCSEDIESVRHVYSSNIVGDTIQPLQHGSENKINSISYDVTNCVCDITCDCCHVLMVTMTSENSFINQKPNQGNITTSNFVSLAYISNSDNPPPISI